MPSKITKTGLILIFTSLVSCSDELRLSQAPILEISAPISFQGSSAILYDTLLAPAGTPYKLLVTYHGEAGRQIPALSFSGSGKGTRVEELKLNTQQVITYFPAREGRHPIYFFYSNNMTAEDCVYLPKEKVLILLTVINQEPLDR